MRCILTHICLLVLIFGFLRVSGKGQAPVNASSALELIKQQQYNQAINKLEQILELSPNHPEALSYLGAAYLYGEGNIARAQELFYRSLQVGGGATFFVQHSHEKLGTSELADYCRGWFYIRKGEVEYSSENGQHSFRISRREIVDMAQNRLSRSMFHVKYGGENFNFRTRSGAEREVLLILVLYQKFAR